MGLNNMDEEIVIHWKAPWWRFWNRNPDTRTYFGSGTVWRDANTGKRLPTSLELYIADVAAYRKHYDTNKNL